MKLQFHTVCLQQKVFGRCVLKYSSVIKIYSVIIGIFNFILSLVLFLWKKIRMEIEQSNLQNLSFELSLEHTLIIKLLQYSTILTRFISHIIYYAQFKLWHKDTILQQQVRIKRSNTLYKLESNCPMLSYQSLYLFHLKPLIWCIR